MDEDLVKKLEQEVAEDITASIQIKDKHAREKALENDKEETLNKYEAQEDEEFTKQVDTMLDHLIKEEVRQLILREKMRADGRQEEEIRPLSSRVGLLPRAHGSGLFTR